MSNRLTEPRSVIPAPEAAVRAFVKEWAEQYSDLIQEVHTREGYIALNLSDFIDVLNELEAWRGEPE